MKKIILLLSLLLTAFISNAQCVSTLAGSGIYGFADGTGTAAQFYYPNGVAVDASANLYVADRNNNRIRKITAAGVVTTLAGSGIEGLTDGTGTAAQFSNPIGVAVDGSGNVYVADLNNNRIRKITAAGVVTTLAGSGIQGSADGTGTSAQFFLPFGVAVDASGNVYVADTYNNRIRKITATGVVTTLAGFGIQGFADGTGTSARFNKPSGVAVDGSGNVYVADNLNHRIRKITAAGVVTTLAGSGVAGFAEGTGTVARFNTPSGVAVDGSGNVYVADTNNNRIRKITAAGIVTTLAGSGIEGFANATGTAAQFRNPIGVAVDSSGNVYVADTFNNRIRKIVPYSTSATINYSTSTFCKSLTTEQLVTLTGTGDYKGGVYSSTIGLTINSSTGAITPSSSTDGTYKVTYTTISSGGCIPVSTSTQVTIMSTFATASINYYPRNMPNCMGIKDVYLTGDGAYLGGTYSADRAGIDINPVTGSINSSNSELGNYTIIYTIPSNLLCLASPVYTYTNVSIYYLEQSLFYSSSHYCDNETSQQPNFPYNYYLYGQFIYFSSPPGLILNQTTGEITPSGSLPGNYVVQREFLPFEPNSTGFCYFGGAEITITAIPTASISYSANPFCKSLTSGQLVSLTGTGVYIGGTYSSTTGLTINTSTGAITPSTSTPGEYTVTYLTPSSGGCQISATTQVTITALPTANISYKDSPFCKSLTSVLAATTGTGAYTTGTYTSTTGLSINATAGAINPSLSTAGTYLVTYTTPASGGCASVSTKATVVILATPTASISANSIINNTISNGNVVPLQLNGSLNAIPNIQWTPATGISSTSISNPMVYPNTTTTYTANFINIYGCPQTTSIQVNVTPQPNLGTLSLSSSNTTSIGLFDTINVDVQLTGATNLYSLFMNLKGNAAVNQYLDYLGYTASTLLGNNVISTPPTVTNNVCDFGIAKVGAASGYSGSGLFYNLRFIPKNIPIPDGTVFCFYLDNVNAYNNSGIPGGLTNQGQYCFTFTNKVNVWPGDLNNSHTVSTADLLPIGYFYNATGSARPNATIQWNAQPITLWGYDHSSSNRDAFKVFADSNGDGVINNADQAAIGFNMSKIHARLAAPITVKKNNTAKLALSSGGLIITPSTALVNATLPQKVTFTVNLNNSGGLSSLYGISVNLLFDNTIFDLSTATIDYTGSIFGNAGTNCLVMNYTSSNIVSVGLTRYANAAINGQGLLFKVTLQTKSPMTSTLTQTPVTAYVDAANNQTGDTLVVQDAPIVYFDVINTLGVETLKSDVFMLYPNPTNDVLYLVLGTNTAQNNNLKLKVINMLGQTVNEMNIQSSTTKVLTRDWGPSGVYFVKVSNTDNAVLMTKKIIVQRK